MPRALSWPQEWETTLQHVKSHGNHIRKALSTAAPATLAMTTGPTPHPGSSSASPGSFLPTLSAQAEKGQECAWPRWVQFWGILFPSWTFQIFYYGHKPAFFFYIQVGRCLLKSRTSQGQWSKSGLPGAVAGTICLAFSPLCQHLQVLVLEILGSHKESDVPGSSWAITSAEGALPSMSGQQAHLGGQSTCFYP